MVVLFLSFWETCIIVFYDGFICYALPPAIHKCSLFSTFLPPILISCLLMILILTRCEVIDNSDCSFDLHFPDFAWLGALSYTCWPLYVFGRSSCAIFESGFGFLWLSCMSFLFWILTCLHIYFCKYIPPFHGFPLLSENVLIWHRTIYLFLFLFYLCFGSKSKKSFQDKCQGALLPVSTGRITFVGCIFE